MDKNLALKINNLNIYFRKQEKEYLAVKDINLNLQQGKTLGIIGESGSGKSLTCSAILGFLDNAKWNVSGSIYFNENKLPYENNKEMNQYRGNHIALISQNPMNSFNPIMTIRKHFFETCSNTMSKIEIENRAINILDEMKIQNPKNVLDSYPYQLSGGMLQRVMIALAIILEPEIIIADEPTTALDLSVQYEIIKILANIQNKLDTSIVLVSHDLAVIGHLAHEVAVMYGGSIVEKADSNTIFNNPKHPYTKGLLKSRPRFSKEPLEVLDGIPPSLFSRGKECDFYSRCNERCEHCKGINIPNIHLEKNHEVKCILLEEELYGYRNA